MEKWTRWFQPDPGCDELRPDEQAFLTALQQAAVQWDVGYAASWANRDEEEHPCLLAVVSISDRNVQLAEFGVHYRDGHAQGDLLHSCLHELPDEPTPDALDVRGEPGQVAAECAAWFESILRRPVVSAQRVYAGVVTKPGVAPQRPWKRLFRFGRGAGI
ncbi:hypothetical protein ABJI51_42690 [Amycolatopsis sp. NEAU-NG30]|uniref:Uncharacterized protein n=1 Tax=Amycolatopsis melonis TaxID=3156488 RepID=A0ABV0LU43_9PSEU